MECIIEIEEVRRKEGRYGVYFGVKGYTEKGRVWFGCNDLKYVSGDRVEVEFTDFERSNGICFLRGVSVRKLWARRSGGWELLAELPHRPAPREAIQLPNIRALFDAALRRKAKRVKIRWGKVTATLCGSRSQYYGQVNLTDDRPYPDNKWYGRLDESGAWIPGRDADADLVEYVKAIDNDPVAAVKVYARDTGVCSFCGKDLSDPNSVAVGYGPTCADKYGLPWGKAEWWNDHQASEDTDLTHRSDD